MNFGKSGTGEYFPPNNNRSNGNRNNNTNNVQNSLSSDRRATPGEQMSSSSSSASQPTPSLQSQDTMTLHQSLAAMLQAEQQQQPVFDAAQPPQSTMSTTEVRAILDNAIALVNEALRDRDQDQVGQGENNNNEDERGNTN